MNICIWTSSIFKLGGTKRVVTIIANEMVKKHSVTIMTFDTPDLENRAMYGLDEKVAVDYLDAPRYKDNGVGLKKSYRTYIKTVNNKSGKYNTEDNIEKLKEAFYPAFIRERYIEHINAQNYDLIIATAGLSLNLATIAKELNCKTAAWQHNCFDAYFRTKNSMYWEKDWLVKKYFKDLDSVIVLNDYDKKEFDEYLDIDTWIAYNPESFTSEEKTDITQKNFFVAARFVKAKGLDLLIKSFEKFCQVNDEWNLIIAGDGPQVNKILSMAEKRGIADRVNYVGLTDNVKQYYLQSSVYLLSSRWEGWGLVIIEAFEMGMPVISYDIVPVDLLITNGEDGLIVNKYDYTAFAAAMVKLANDEDLRREMAEKAIKKAQEFSVERIYANWEKWMREELHLI